MLILAAFGFVLLNGFFVLAEFSLVKMRQTQVEKLKKSKKWKDKVLIRVHQKMDAYLSACQLGITFSSLGLGWIGEPAFAELLTPLLTTMGIFSETAIHIITFIFAFSIISYIHIVIGELMPKSMAIRNPVKMSSLSAAPLYIFYWVMYPLIALLNKSANKILEWVNLDHTSAKDHFISAEELKIILQSSHHQGALSHKEVKTLNHLLEFHKLHVSDVMRPIEDLISLDISKPINETFRTILRHHFSRYPIYNGNRTEILGMIHVKDLMAALFPNNRIKDIKRFIRPILQVQKTDDALNILDDFRRGASHLALVYSGKELVGFLTFDNLLQVLTGKIKDEFHFSADDVMDMPDGSFLLKGSSSVYVLERMLAIDLSSYPVSTIMGLILHEVKNMPLEGQIVKFEQFSLLIEKRKDPKHIWVRVIPM